MFDELSARFEDAVKGLRGQDQISETNVEGALKDVRRALLEADVSLPVVKDFVAEVREKAVGAEGHAPMLRASRVGPTKMGKSMITKEPSTNKITTRNATI